MIVTDRFVFLHLHKSGGTFVNAFLRVFFPDAEFIGYHLPRSHLPRYARHLPIFGVIRNPWDYYVSWHAFQMEKARPNALYRIASDDGRLGFNATIRHLVNLCEDEDRHAALVATLPREFSDRGLNLTRDCIKPLLGSTLGFYSFLYHRMFGDGRHVTFGRMESLRSDLLGFLEGIEVPITPEMRTYVLESPPLNASAHAPYRTMYDEATRDAVAQRDAAIIERFQQKF